MPSADEVALPAALRRSLCCPWCSGPLVDQTGRLECSSGHSIPINGRVMEALVEPADDASRSTFASFGYEWSVFDGIQPEDEDYWHWYIQDVPLDTLKGRMALDAGCGKGRYTSFTAPHVEWMVALEPSIAVFAAARNLQEVPNASLVRADLRSAPFAAGTFGFISCLGVLHHLSDPEQGFRELVRLLAPGGLMLLYLYSRPSGNGVRRWGLAVAAALRAWSVRIPHPLLRLLCWPLALVLSLVFVLPGRVGEVARIPRLRALPLHVYRGRPLRALWLDTFDRLSAPLERRYIWAELEPWFQATEMTVRSAREDAGWFIVLEKSSM